MSNISDMIQNPQNYGFSWGYGRLEKGGMELTLEAPYIIHEDVEKCMATFGPTYFLDMANGTSGRVRDQLLRNDIFANRDLLKDPDAMKAIVLKRALGQKSPRVSRGPTVVVEKIVEKTVEVRTYIADDGEEFTDKAECMAHNAELKFNL